VRLLRHGDVLPAARPRGKRVGRLRGVDGVVEDDGDEGGGEGEDGEEEGGGGVEGGFGAELLWGVSFLGGRDKGRRVKRRTGRTWEQHSAARFETKAMVLPMTRATVGRTLNSSGQRGRRKAAETCVSLYTRSVLAETPRTVRPIRSASAVVPVRALSMVRTKRILSWRWRSCDSASNEDAEPWERLLFSILYGFRFVDCTALLEKRAGGWMNGHE
jgi:hypothetical protein